MTCDPVAAAAARIKLESALYDREPPLLLKDAAAARAALGTIERSRDLNATERAYVARLDDDFGRGFRENGYTRSLFPKVTRRQQTFLALDEHREVMFGGSAGSAKSWALLIAALQFADRPNYSALLLRKSYADLVGEGCLVDVARKLLAGSDAKWRASEWAFVFPSGSRLAFGHLGYSDSHLNYDGGRYDFVGFDELFHLKSDEQYRYLFSRVRRAEGSRIPPRVRSATNPGGAWIKERFVPDAFFESPFAEAVERVWEHEGRTFVPSHRSQNEFLDNDEYSQMLAALPRTERLRLDAGRWDVAVEGGIFLSKWLRRRFGWKGQHVVPRPIGDEREPIVGVHETSYFLTVDCAATRKTTSDYTVCGVWGHDSAGRLFLVDGFRERDTAPAIARRITELYREWGAEAVVVEAASSGHAVSDLLKEAGRMNVILEAPTTDKVVRSREAQRMCEAGNVYFTEDCTHFVDTFVEEVAGFDGLGTRGTHDDCVDCLSYAANYVRKRGGRRGPMTIHAVGGIHRGATI